MLIQNDFRRRTKTNGLQMRNFGWGVPLSTLQTELLKKTLPDLTANTYRAHIWQCPPPSKVEAYVMWF